MATLVRAIGALASVMFVLGVVVLIKQATGPKTAATLPLGLKSPGLAIEFAEFDKIKGFLGELVNGDSPMRQKIRQGLYGDYVFIAMYWLLFAGMSALLIGRNHAWAVVAGVIAAVCATGAAIFDVVENLSTAALLDAAEIQPALVRNVVSAGFGKWFLLFLATLILSLVFLRKDWLALLGVLYILIAVIGIYGLRRDPRFVERAFTLYFVGVLVIAIVFSLWPQKVLERL